MWNWRFVWFQIPWLNHYALYCWLLILLLALLKIITPTPTTAIIILVLTMCQVLFLLLCVFYIIYLSHKTLWLGTVISILQMKYSEKVVKSVLNSVNLNLESLFLTTPLHYQYILIRKNSLGYFITKAHVHILDSIFHWQEKHV